MNYETYVHNYGLHAIPAKMVKELKDVINEIDYNIQPRCATSLRKMITVELMMLGWSDKTRIDAESQVTITAMKSKVGLCLQTGNISRMYADLIKLQYLYQKDKIDSAFYILPSKESAKIMGDNVANIERLSNELQLYRYIISLPILVIGLC